MEAHNLKNIMAAVGSGLCRIFRNNTGTGWAGRVVRIPNSSDVLVKDARPLHAGLCVGSSDLIGWKRVTITPEMVGKEVAVFVALEVKNHARSTVTEEQKNFIEMVRGSGGIAGVVVSVEDAKRILQ